MDLEKILQLGNFVANPVPAAMQYGAQNPEALKKAAVGALPGGSAWNLLNAYGDKQAADAQKQQGEEYLLNRLTTQNFADQGLNPDGSMQEENYVSPNSNMAQFAAPSPQGQGGGISAGYANAYKKLMDAQMRSQQLGEEELKTLKDRLEKLKGQPVDNQSLAKTLAAAADVWGGGEGQFTKLQGALNPNMTEAQKAAAIAQLEDTVRKGRGDLTAAEVAMNKAQMGYEADKMALASKGAKGGEQLPAGQVAELGDLSTVGSQVDNMSNEWVKLFGEARKGDPKDISQSGWLSAQIPGTPENIFESSRRQWAQTIGVPLEGGKLTDPDYKRYLDNFIPSATDSVERARAKAQNLKKYAAEKQAQRLKAFAMAGYDTRGFGGGGSQVDPQVAAAARAELARRGK